MFSLLKKQCLCVVVVVFLINQNLHILDIYIYMYICLWFYILSATGGSVAIYFKFIKVCLLSVSCCICPMCLTLEKHTETHIQAHIHTHK